MSEVIASKRIVITAEDRATSIVAKTNEAFARLESHLQQLGMKFNTGATEQSSYRSALDQTKTSANETDAAIKKLDSDIAKTSGIKRDIHIGADTDSANEKLKQVEKSENDIKNNQPVIKPKADTDQATNGVNNLKNAADRASESGKSMTKSFVFGSWIANGIQSASSSLLEFAKQGFQAAIAGEEVSARWANLGMAQSQIKVTGAAVRDLKENTNMSGEAVGNLVTRFYGMTRSTSQTIALSKGVGSITDSLHLSQEASDAFANGLARIEASGKVTSQSLGRLERQAPGLSSALQKASGMSKKAFDDLLSSGKMTTDQFNQILERASKSYQEHADDWNHTAAGALHHMTTAWADDWKTAMSSLAQSSGQGLGALANALNKLQPQFAELGEAIGRLSARFAEWLTPQHAEDLGKIVGSVGRMAVTIGKGVWQTFSGIIRIIAKAFGDVSDHGDALDDTANALDHISKNKAAMTVLEGIGAILATQFVYSKLFKIGSALLGIGSALKSIGSAKLSGNIFNDVAVGLSKLKDIKLDGSLTKAIGPRGVLAQEAEKGGDSAGAGFMARMMARIRNTKIGGKLFGSATASAEAAGAESGAGFLARFASKIRVSGGLLAVGKGLASKIGAGLTIGLSAIDVARALTPSFKGDRWTMMGKGAGGLIGGGIGMFFGGAAGATIGSIIGSVVGGWLGKAAHKGFNLMKGIFNGKITFHSIETGFMQTMNRVSKWARDTWKKIKAWWNDDPTSSSSSSKSRQEPSQKEIKSLGGNHYSKSDIANIKQMNAAVRAYTASLKQLKAVVKKDDPTKQLRNMSKEFKSINPEVRNSAKYWKELAKPLETSSKSFKTLDKSLEAFKKKNNPLDRLTQSVEKLTKTVKKEQFGKLLAKQMQIADKSMSGKHSFVGQFESMTKKVIKQLQSFRKSFNADWRNTWTRLDRYPSQGLSRVASTVANRLSSVLSREHSFTSRFISSWRSWIDDVVSAMRSGFNKLPDIAQKAMQGIVSRLNSGISAINAVISDFGGDKQLSSIHYARGTMFHPGGKAILNDGLTPKKQEIVWEPSKGFSLPKGQNIVYDLERGGMVLDASHSDHVLNRMGIPHYAGGTLSDDEQDQIAEEFMDNPIKASRDLVLKVTNWNSNVPVIADLGKATAIGFSRGIANVLKDLLGIIKEPINGDWTPVIKSAFRVLHLHAQGWQIAKFLRQIQTESGGSETIIGGTDGLSDGHATGLLQFKPGTFAHWADPRYSNIMKGFDQIVAAIRCLNAGGEGGWGNFGMGHGWATGGEITSQQFGWVGDNAQHHEFVINPYNSNALPLMSKAWTIMNNNHPEWSVPSENAFSSEMVALMKAAIAAIDNIDIQPVAFVDDAARAINNRNARQIAMMRGGK